MSYLSSSTNSLIKLYATANIKVDSVIVLLGGGSGKLKEVRDQEGKKA
jgi:hypothetical protein